jgi:hypothetical protein
MFGQVRWVVFGMVEIIVQKQQTGISCAAKHSTHFSCKSQARKTRKITARKIWAIKKPVMLGTNGLSRYFYAIFSNKNLERKFYPSSLNSSYFLNPAFRPSG